MFYLWFIFTHILEKVCGFFIVWHDFGINIIQMGLGAENQPTEVGVKP
jgi:hypothetical protein